MEILSCGWQTRIYWYKNGCRDNMDLQSMLMEKYLIEINLRSIARSLLRWNVSHFLVNRIALMQSKGENESRYQYTSISLSITTWKGRIYELCSLNAISNIPFHCRMQYIADIYSFERSQYQWFIVQKFCIIPALHYPQIKVCIKCLWWSRTKWTVDIDQIIFSPKRK